MGSKAQRVLPATSKGAEGCGPEAMHKQAPQALQLRSWPRKKLVAMSTSQQAQQPHDSRS